MGDNVLITLLGLIPFFLMFLLLWIYLVCRTKERQIYSLLSEIRINLRSYQNKASRLGQESSVFSPYDPEPFGELSEIFNNRMVDFENSLTRVYADYGELHQRLSKWKLTPIWASGFFLFRWNALVKEAEKIWYILETLEEDYLLLLQSSDKLKKLGFEISKKCMELTEKINDAHLILRNLQLRITGETFQVCERSVRKWDETLKTQIPVSFLNANEDIGIDAIEKDEITRVHRVLISAAPGINAVYDKVKRWQNDINFIMSSLPDLKEKQAQLVHLMEDFETRKVSPIQWDKSRAHVASIKKQMQDLKIIEAPITIEDLREITHNIKRVTAQQAELDSNCLKVQANSNELLLIWSSMELQQGTEWIRSVRKVLDAAADYDDTNWHNVDNLNDFRSQVTELAKKQNLLLPLEPVQIIRESKIDHLVVSARELLDLHRKLRYRFVPIHDRLKYLQSLRDDRKEKLVGAKAVLNKTLPVIYSNPLLKKSTGNVTEKLQVSLELLLVEIDAKDGLVEKKVQKVDSWIEKTEQLMNKWLELLANDLDVLLVGLGEIFQTLGFFLNIQDLVITEARDILRKMEQNDGTGLPLYRPGDDPLLVVSKKLWATNDDWQKVVSVERALMDVAAPVLERFRKVEKSRETAMNQMKRGNILIPAELQWPPTAQYLGLERRQYQDLEMIWQSLRQENIQAIQLVGKLSDLSESYHTVAAQISQKVDKAEQEQAKIRDYERKLDESKRMWLVIAEKYPEYKTLRNDLDKLFIEIDRDYTELKKQYAYGGLPYNQALQNLRIICRKINEITMPAVGNQVVDINGDLQKRMY